MRQADVQAYFDARPLRFTVLLLVVFFPLVSIGSLVRPLIRAAAQRQGLVFVVAYDIIRLAAEWLASLYSSFWYVQCSTISVLEGAKKWSAAGGFFIWGTIFSFALSLATAGINFGVAEPLLRAVVPIYADPSLLVTVALGATYAMGLFIPARVSVSNSSGLLLGMAGKNMLLTIPAYLFAFGLVLVGGGVMAALFLNSGCEAEIAAANASAGGAFVPETYVCSTGASTLTSASWLESSFEALAGALTLLVGFLVARRRGYFKQHGCSLLSYASASRAAVGDQTTFTFRMCSVHFAMVNLRSILNNTRDLISPIVATRIGIVESAAYSFFEEVGSLSYTVPNILSVCSMIIGARLLGAKRLKEFKQLMYVHSVLALVMAIVSLLLAVVSKDLQLDALVTNKVDQAVFLPLAERLWPAAIVLQPLRAVVAVYGPVLMGCQGYVEWGVIVTVLFTAVYLPMTLAGAARGDIELLVWANVIYYAAHLLALVAVVHLRLLPRIMRDGGVDGGDKGAVLGAVASPAATSA